MKYLFIDSNIWLSLYYFSNDDLEQFSKLKEHVGKTIRLLIPKQTKDEVLRNRDIKISEALKGFEKFEIMFPAFAKAYPEYSTFFNSYRELKASHSNWLMKIRDDIHNQGLRADTVIREFFSSEVLLECEENTIRVAELRYKSGNPPGKDNKYGDAINWECLLNNVPEGEDLYLISADKDYRSAVDENDFNLFLREEWKTKKKAKVHYFKTLTSFLNQHIKDIKLNDVQQKDDLITALKCSRNFANTHAIIKQLCQYPEWTAAQKNDLVEAALSNNQVRWIIHDDDIAAFYKKLIEQNAADIDEIDRIRELLSDDEEDNEIEDDPTIDPVEVIFDDNNLYELPF